MKCTSLTLVEVVSLLPLWKGWGLNNQKKGLSSRDYCPVGYAATLGALVHVLGPLLPNQLWEAADAGSSTWALPPLKPPLPLGLGHLLPQHGGLGSSITPIFPALLVLCAILSWNHLDHSCSHGSVPSVHSAGHRIPASCPLHTQVRDLSLTGQCVGPGLCRAVL